MLLMISVNVSINEFRLSLVVHTQRTHTLICKLQMGIKSHGAEELFVTLIVDCS